MWDFFETVRHRHSVRRYQADMPVEQDKLHAVIETACSAPSAGDLQAYQIIVIRDAARREALREVVQRDHDFVAQAPVSMLFCADPKRSAERFGERGAQLFAVQDATIAAGFAQLAAVAAGLASAWIGQFDPAAARCCMDLPQSLEPVALLCFGYAAELPALTPRRKLDEVVRYI